MEEIEIEGSNGMYFIREDGAFISLKRGEKKILKGGITFDKTRKKEMYKNVCVYLNNKQISLNIHVLVAKAFVPNPDNKPEVNHKDGNKLNNHKDNLEWSTRAENAQHMYDNGLFIHFMKQEPHRTKEVDKYLSTGVSEVPNAIRNHITKTDLERNNLPPELLRCSLKNQSFKETWKYYNQIYDLINTDKTSREIASILDVDLSLVSRIRNGLRFQKQMKLVKKYRELNLYSID